MTPRSHNEVREGLERYGLYHSIRLPDGQVLPGAMPIDYLESRVRAFGIQDNLSGQRALDIGPWDGYFTFELERRGAEVTAIDYVDLDTFRWLHRAMDSRARYLRNDVYELDPAQHGLFDVVLCLGVLYHTKHPLLALERVCAVTRGVCIVESFVTDANEWIAGERDAMPSAEFYEAAELGGQLDNWCGPNINNLTAWARAAGFAEVEVRHVHGRQAIVACYRHWRRPVAPGAGRTQLTGVTSHLHRGRCFRSHKEEYLQLWTPLDAPLGEVFPEVSGFGIAPLACAATESGTAVSVRLPPGLTAGAHQVRLRVKDLDWSEPIAFYLDLSDSTSPLDLHLLQDAVTDEAGVVDRAKGGWLTLWVTGLTPEADAGNVIIHVDGVPHFPDFVDPRGQVNVPLRRCVAEGRVEVMVEHRGQRSQGVALEVRGAASLLP